VDFSGETTFRPLGGCCPLKVLYALEIDQTLIARTQISMGVPQKTFAREILKCCLKFSVLATITFVASGSILTKHFPYNVPRGRGHNIGITFGRPAL